MSSHQARDAPFHYDAFLSYRAMTDYGQARKIEAFLESFHANVRSATVTVRQLQICRDGSDFTLPTHRSLEPGISIADGGDGDPIWKIIEAELSRARFLIVLCSPGAIQSTYVSKEIGWFVANRGKQWIIPVVTGGEDPKNKPEECFPAAIIEHQLHESLIWYDLRGASRSAGQAGVRDYEDEMVRLAADLLSWDSATQGPLSAIWQREQSKRRRRQSIVLFAAAALFLIVGGYAFTSAQQKEEALRQNLRLQSQRDGAIRERERAANERDRAQNDRDTALDREKIQAEKAVAAAKIAEQNAAEAKRQEHIAVDNAKRVYANSLSAAANGLPDLLESALVLTEVPPEIPPARGESTARKLAGSPIPYAIYQHYDESSEDESSEDESSEDERSKGRLWGATFTADGKHVLLDPLYGEMMSWAVDGRNDPVKVEQLLPSSAFDSGGAHIIVAYADRSTVARPLPPATGQSTEREEILLATISGDGGRIATITDKGELSLWTNQRIARRSRRPETGDVLWSAVRSSPQYDTEISNGMEFVGRAELSGEPLSLHVLPEAGRDPIRAAAFSPDGYRLAAGYQSGLVRIWWFDRRSASPTPNQETTTLEGHTDTITSLSYSRDSEVLVTSSQDQTARVWSDGDDPVVLRGHTDEVTRASLSPDARYVATAGEDGTARLWLSTGRLDPTSARFGFYSPFHPEWFALSPDGTRIVAVSEDAVIRWYSTVEFDRLKLLREEKVKGAILAIANDADQLAVSQSGRILIYSLTGDLKARVLPSGPTGEVGGGLFTRDGRLFALRSADNSALYVWSVDRSSSPVVLHDGLPIVQVALSSDGRYIAVVSDWSDSDESRNIRVWNLGVNGGYRVLKGHTAAINAIAFSRVAPYLVSAASDNDARIWNLDRAGDDRRLRHGGRVLDADFSPDGSKVVTVATDRKVRVWSASNPKEKPLFRDLAVADENDMPKVTFNADGRQMLAVFNYRVEFWLNDGQSESNPVFGENMLVRAFGYSANGDRAFIYNSGDNTLSVYRLSWRSLREGLRSYMTECLPASRRVEILGETRDQARTAFLRCEQDRRTGPAPTVNAATRR